MPLRSAKVLLDRAGSVARTWPMRRDCWRDGRRTTDAFARWATAVDLAAKSHSTGRRPMTESVRLAPPNNLILVLDPDSGELPETVGRESVAASASAIAIDTLAEFDGETTINLGTPEELPDDSSLALRWTGTLATSGRLAVLTRSTTTRS